MSAYFVQVPVHRIHGKAEHKHGEGSAHVNPLSDDSGWEELASDFVKDTSSCEEVHCVLHEPYWASSRQHDVNRPMWIDFFEGLGHVDE